MCRITTRIKAAAIALALALLAAGCSPDYSRKDVGPDSPEGRAVSKMLVELHDAGDAGLARFIEHHAAGSLTQPQQQNLRAVLGWLAKSPRLKLTRFDRFGGRIYRAGIEAGPGRTVYLLLVKGDDGAMRWAGPN